MTAPAGSLGAAVTLQLRAWRAALALSALARNAAQTLEMRGLTLERGVYGDHPLEVLDRIARSSATPSVNGARPPLPVVFIHGGGWVSGGRALYRTDLAPFARRGHVVFNLDYPLAPEAPFPHGLAAVIRALAWLRAHEPGCHEVLVLGDSAGGNLAMMAAILLTNRRLLEALDPALARLELPAVRKVVSIYGVLDRHSWLEAGFPSARMFMQCYGGAIAFERGVRPENAFTPADLTFDRLPETLLIGAGRDPLCPSTRLCAEDLARRGLPARSKIYPNERHGFFSMPWRAANREAKRDILAFLAD